MLKLVLRRMLGNFWIMSALLLGTMLVVSMVSSIPLYTESVLQRMLTKQLEEQQLSQGIYPGNYTVSATINANAEKPDNIAIYRQIDLYMKENVLEKAGLPLIATSSNIEASYIEVLEKDAVGDREYRRSMKITAIPGILDKIVYLAGERLDNKATAGALQAVVTQQAFIELELSLGETYVIVDVEDNLRQVCEIVLVGIFEPADFSDPFWFRELWAYRSAFVVLEDDFEQVFIESHAPKLSKVFWNHAFDYYSLTLQNLDRLLSVYNDQRRFMDRTVGIWEISAPAVTSIGRFRSEERNLRLMVLVIEVPVLIMLVFYISMVSTIIIDSRGTEITVLKSRGMTARQLMFSYLIEISLIGAAAMILGPPFGLFLVKMLGATKEFLFFVQRTALPVSLNGSAYLYGLIAVVLLICTMMLPVSRVSRKSIVTYKQKKARGKGHLTWQKTYVDILLLAISGYGLYTYWIQRKAVSITGLAGSDVAFGPLSYLASTLFVIGAGLFFLRFFPFLLKIVFRMGAGKWPPPLYAALIHLERSGGTKILLMLFIVFSSAIGIFSANAARTLSRHMEERIYYENGTDIVLMSVWGVGVADTLPPFLGIESTESTPVTFEEPPFLDARGLTTIAESTRVLRKKNVELYYGGGSVVNKAVTLMGIMPDEFGRTAWFRNDLLPVHWYNYLNVLAAETTAVLLSESARDELEIEVGDTVSITWGRQQPVDFVVLAFVKYWPGFNPAVGEQGTTPILAVGNFEYIRSMTVLEPYEVWMRKTEGVSSEEVYDELSGKGLAVRWFHDSSQEALSASKSPFIQSVNGALTLGFCIAVGLTVMGYLVYWITSLKQRYLQFGVLRAMGLSVRSLMLMLFTEQIILTVSAIVAGVGVGGLASRLFIPLLQIAYSAAEEVPPIRIIFERLDYIRVYSVVGFMIVVCIGVLFAVVSKMQMTQALKLGEE